MQRFQPADSENHSAARALSGPSSSGKARNIMRSRSQEDKPYVEMVSIVLAMRRLASIRMFIQELPGTVVSALRCPPQPVHPELPVLLKPFPVEIHPPEIGLRHDVAVAKRLVQPMHRFVSVLSHSFSIEVCEEQFDLRA